MDKTNPGTITLYHSADSDDAFMYWALKKGIIDSAPFSFKIKAGNTEDLNQLALTGEPDICALSIYTYGFIFDQYLLCSHSGSMGRNYGPVIVARKPYSIKELPNLVVATPGEKTTAHCLLKLFAPQVKTKIVPIVPFERVLQAIDRGEVDAGLLIHEGLLIYPYQGLYLVADLGKWWFQKTSLPLPLGGTVIKRALGEETVVFLSSCLRESIQYALAHREEVLANIIQEDPRIAENLHDPKLINKYLSLYANEDTLDYGVEGRKAIKTFFDLVYESGLLPRRVQVKFIS
ncbi:MAG TPA: ABC transporter substrate-binding protein [Thermodesulfobacteriota bacterium]|nr:ABC transporter substrate-binding protein [Thermodesulfobacteriota bacterium]